MLKTTTFFSGILGGRSSSLYSESEQDFTEKRKKELSRGEALQSRFKKVAKQAKKTASREYLGRHFSSSDDEEDSLMEVPQKRQRSQKVAKSSNEILKILQETQDEILDRLIRIEHKVDDIQESRNLLSDANVAGTQNHLDFFLNNLLF